MGNLKIQFIFVYVHFQEIPCSCKPSHIFMQSLNSWIICHGGKNWDWWTNSDYIHVYYKSKFKLRSKMSKTSFLFSCVIFTFELFRRLHLYIDKNFQWIRVSNLLGNRHVSLGYPSALRILQLLQRYLIIV